ncbi:MAG: twin-arginine translocation pathway signal protein [Sphingomonadales bacterium 63-6]|nr:MAG: twin-arginine translocation pathway signal protein [Sphingomonadales bacterium 63-6]
MNLNIMGASLPAAILLMAGQPAFAEEMSAPVPIAAVGPQQQPPFVPADFNVPTLVEAAGFKLVPLGPEVVNVDFDAYMSSIEHLQGTFSRSTGWPHKDISAADAMRDMEGEQARFSSRRSFAYAVLTPDGSRERGSVYVSPSPVPGYDAVVRMWVTKAEYDAGFDAELYRWASDWVGKEWPFQKVAYPGRAIDWASWDAMVAANAVSKTAPSE